MTAEVQRSELTLNTTLNEKRPLQILTVVIAGTGVVVVWLAWLSYAAFTAQANQGERRFRQEALVERLNAIDELLTMSAYQAVTTLDPEWDRRHREYRSELSAVFETVQSATLFPSSSQVQSVRIRLARVQEQLDTTHAESVRLARTGELARALGVFTAKEYVAQRRAFGEETGRLSAIAEGHEAARLKVQRRDARLRSLGLVIVVVIVVVAWWRAVWTARSWRSELLRTNSRLVRRAEELRELNQTMERKVV